MCKVVVLLHKPIVLGALGPMAFVHLSYVKTDATLVDVTCCVLILRTLLHVVGSCCAKFETGQTFSHVQTDATIFLLLPFAWGFASVSREL